MSSLLKKQSQTEDITLPTKACHSRRPQVVHRCRRYVHDLMSDKFVILMVRTVTSSAGALAHRDPASAAAQRGGTHGSCRLEVPWHMLPPESMERVHVHLQPPSNLYTIHTYTEIKNSCYNLFRCNQ